MTTREAMIQAHMELGKSREAAELSAKFADAALPGAAGPTESLVKPGLERECIEGLKKFLRKLNATPGAQEALEAKINKRSGRN